MAVYRHNAFPLFALLFIKQTPKQLHIHLTIFRKCHNVTVQSLVIVLFQPSPLLKMFQTHGRHIRTCKKLSLFIIIFLIPQKSRCRDLFIHNCPALFFRQSKHGIRQTHFLIDCREKQHIVIRIFT